jgi:hypothetical protein
MHCASALSDGFQSACCAQLLRRKRKDLRPADPLPRSVRCRKLTDQRRADPG